MLALNTIMISIEDLLKCDYDSLINASEPTIWKYYCQLSKASQEEREKGNISKANALYLLAEACSPMLDASNHKKPFKPHYTFQGHRSTIPDDFSIEQGQLLALFAPEVNNSAFAARLADLGWVILHKNINSAKHAIISYIDAGAHPYCKEHWYEKIEYLERALRLSRMLNDDKRDVIVKKLSACIDINSADYDLRAGVRVCQLLLNTNSMNNIELAEKALTLAEKIEDISVYDAKCSLLDVATKCFHKDKNHTKAEECKLMVYEVLLAKAKQAEQADSMIIAGHFYKKVVKVLQNCKGQQEKVKEIQQIFIRVNKDSLKEMKTISSEVDTTEFFKAISNRMKKIIHDDKAKTLVYFALFTDIPLKKKDLEAAVLKLTKSAPIISTIPKPIINGDGRIVKVIKPLLGSEGEEYFEALKASCYECAKISYQLSAENILIIRDEIIKLHNINGQSIYELIQYSDFLPEDRLNLWTKGILAGFNHEFDIALSLLIPQFEHALRKILEARGVTVLHSDPESGIHSEMTLNQLIAMKETQGFFGEDLQFELQGLLTERLGFNYRNEFAHGLMSESGFYSPAAIYLWWLLLHIVIRCNPIN